MISLTHTIAMRGYELNEAGKHFIAHTKVLKFPLPLNCEWDNGEIILRQASNEVIILN